MRILDGGMLEWWRTVAGNDFDRGYVIGVALALLVLVSVLALKIVFRLVFRSRRCREIVVRSADGDIFVTYGALNDALFSELESFEALKVRDIRLSRVRGRYFLDIFCTYDVSDDGRFPEEARLIKARIFDALREHFGIVSVCAVRIRLEHVTGQAASRNDSGEKESSAESSGGSV